MLTILPRVLSEVIAHAEAEYPREACGLLLLREGRWRVRPMENAYDRYHVRDPLGYPRTSRTAYRFDSREQLRVWTEAEGNGELIACVYHSHVDAGAYFSAEDRAMAAPGGEPLLPSTAYLVVSIEVGKAKAAKLFWWESGDFRESNLSAGNL